MNAGIYQRGRQEDYENWPWSSEEILSSFQSIEAELALEWVDGGPIAQEFLDAVVQNGGIEIPKITKSNDGGGKLPQEPSFTTTDNGICSGIWFTTAGGRRRTSWDTFIAPLLDMPNLTVLHDFFARRILWEKSEKGGGQLRASGVEGALNGSPLKILFSSSSSSGDSYSKDKPHEILLCCGAVGSPVLLMHSGVGPRRSLQQAGISVSCDAPKVGVGLQDHIVLPIVWYLPGGSNTSLSTTTTYSNGVRAAIEAKASNGSALQLLLHDFTNSLEIIGSCSRYLFVSTLIRWIIFVTLWILFNFPFSRMILKLLLKRSFFVTSICLTGVTSSGNIALTSSDPYEMPIIDPCYLSEESEWAAFEEGLKLARLSGRWRHHKYTNGGSLLSPIPLLPSFLYTQGGKGFRQLVKNLALPYFHHSSSCRMPCRVPHRGSSSSTFEWEEGAASERCKRCKGGRLLHRMPYSIRPY